MKWDTSPKVLCCRFMHNLYVQWVFEQNLNEKYILYKTNVCLSTAGLLDQAHEHLKEAVYLFGRVCDDLNSEACYCHSLLAKVAFLQGKAAEVG